MDDYGYRYAVQYVTGASSQYPWIYTITDADGTITQVGRASSEADAHDRADWLLRAIGARTDERTA